MKPDCCVLNGGKGSWAFEPLAQQLSSALGIPISAEPTRFNYLLHLDTMAEPFPHPLFIPLSSIRTASDKRLVEAAFARNQVPTPFTHLAETFAEAVQFVAAHPESEWCLKYPTSCGANGHRMITSSSPKPPKWPRPFIVQEFIRQERPEVYRIYCAGGELFGWVARRFPENVVPSPWVAHARGARYKRLGQAPRSAESVARAALVATGLLKSFGCVDLLSRSNGEWLALEVGTDGVYNYVDRELDDPELESEILQRITRAFLDKASTASNV